MTWTSSQTILEIDHGRIRRENRRARLINQELSQMNVNYDSDEEKTDDGDNPEFNIELFTFARAYTMQYVDMYYDFRVITAGLDNGTPGSIARVLPEILVMYNKECHDGKLLAKLKSLIRFLIDLTEDAPHNIYSSTKYLIRQLAKKLT